MSTTRSRDAGVMSTTRSRVPDCSGQSCSKSNSHAHCISQQLITDSKHPVDHRQSYTRPQQADTPYPLCGPLAPHMQGHVVATPGVLHRPCHPGQAAWLSTQLPPPLTGPGLATPPLLLLLPVLPHMHGHCGATPGRPHVLGPQAAQAANVSGHCLL
jgi:hypothetical protein